MSEIYSSFINSVLEQFLIATLLASPSIQSGTYELKGEHPTMHLHSESAVRIESVQFDDRDFQFTSSVTVVEEIDTINGRGRFITVSLLSKDSSVHNEVKALFSKKYPSLEMNDEEDYLISYPGPEVKTSFGSASLFSAKNTPETFRYIIYCYFD